MMDGAATDPGNTEGGALRDSRRRWRKKRWQIPLGLLIVVLLGLAAAWRDREDIASNIIARQLEQYDLPATYEIERIGGRTQIFTDVVIGDPQAPDFTAERVIVTLRHRLGLPSIGRITLVRPRLYGSFRDGEISFGTLDRVLFRDTGAPPGLPEIDIAIRDGRALIETDYGPVGAKLEGSGPLDDGFAGIVALNAPQLDLPGCEADRATAYGRITSEDGAPRFSGPVRVAALACPASAFRLASFNAAVDAKLDETLARPEVEARIDSGAVRYGPATAEALTGTIRGQMGEDVLLARYSLAARGVATPQALAAVLTAEGVLRARDGLARLEVESEIEGNGLRLGPAFESSLAALADTGRGTLVGPIAQRITGALRDEARGSALRADLTLRKTGDRLTIFAPRAEMDGGSGAQILSLSRVEWSNAGAGPPQIAGNLSTGGPRLPRLTGRMERAENGDTVFRLRMAEYQADGSSLEIPGLTIAQAENGALGFSGEVIATGPIPGGSASGLRVPVSGRWMPGGDVALWRRCTDISFDGLVLADLALTGHAVTICPAPGRPILRYGEAGLRVAAGATSLDLAGTLGETPIRLSTGPVGFAYPGVMRARRVAVALGPAATASRFTISDLTARLGDAIDGTFADAEVRLDAVPLDIVNASGRWDYTDGRLTLSDGAFRLLDRAAPDRFEPLAARDARLTLESNIVEAFAELRHPATDRLVTAVDIYHNLASGTGYADLTVDGVTFDEALQPVDLTRLALGVVANARGVVTGTGRIDWNAGGVTSTGAFSSDDLDFAAAFGPVEGASGTVVFTDLLGLTTAPDQVLRVASVNPGIEVLDGEVTFQLRNGQLLALSGGRWPFMGGTLILRSVDFNLGVSEERRYVFEIVGLQAADFIAQMELENISATGTFDGTVPIVFDANGDGRIEEGVLISRPPGGNISYVGELTYEDLSPIANFAFDALRSLDYTQMRVAMEGPLTGEIVTRVRFDGVSQGEGAKSNIITRQLARLPIQFRINIRAQFYQLLTSVKSLYDPAAVRDPRELGLLSDDGTRLRREVTGEEVEPDIDPDDLVPDESAIQEQESETML